jgi:hypothetical protein
VSDHVAPPQAWQAKRSFRVVAHATGLLLATARAVAPPGGRHRAPPEDNGLQHARRLAVVPQARRAPVVFVDRNEILDEDQSGGTPCAEGVFPPVFPLLKR